MPTSASTNRTLVFVALLCVMCLAAAVLLHHCALVACCNGRRRRLLFIQHHRGQAAASADPQQQQQEEEEAGYSVDMISSSSRAHLVKGAPVVVVCPYRKEEAWSESTCPVCLADFADGESVRVLPECMHYFHAECIDTWLRGSNSCPLCRAETTPTPSLRDLSDVSVSLEEILVRTT